MNFNNTSNSSPKKGSGPNSKKEAQKIDRNATDNRPEVSVYKYSCRGNGLLHEAIILAGLPIFLTYQNGKPTLVNKIKEPRRILTPPTLDEYAYEPYEFSSIQEIQSYMDDAQKESIGSLLLHAKSLVGEFNDQDGYKIMLASIDVVWSYFQDRFSTTHYVGVIGDNGSGKSSIGDTFEAIGYRTVNMTDPTSANLFRVLGKVEPGQCTIVADEADKIDQSPDIMSTMKTGYQIKGKVARVNMNTGKQEFFWTYCFKMIIAEKSPDQTKAKGVLDRTLLFTTYNGNPRYDIKEVLNPAGDLGRQKLLDELKHFRKLMLIDRLIHFKDPIPDIDIGLQGREKELCKPSLQLFHNVNLDMQKEIIRTFQKFIDEKNRRKGNVLEAALYPIITNLVSAHGREIYSALLWGAIMETMGGFADERKPNEYQTYDYGTLYRNTITNIVCDKFGAFRKRKNDGTVLIFDPENLAKVGKGYNIECKIQTKLFSYDNNNNTGSGEISNGGSSNNTSVGSECSEGVKENSSSPEQTNNGKNSSTDTSTAEKSRLESNNANTIYSSTSSSKYTELVDCFWSNNQDKQHLLSPKEASQPSQPSLQVAGTPHNTIHRLGRSDIFRCDNCKLRGDRWEMEKHPCRRSR